MRALLNAAFLTLAVTACGNDLSPPRGSATMPSIGLAVTGAANVTRGSSAQVAVTVSRVEGFTGDIGMSVESLPAGVTAVFAPATVTGFATSSTLTLSASSTATLGTVSATLRANAIGVVGASIELAVAVSP